MRLQELRPLGTDAHSPGSTVLPPEGVGWGLGELVRVSTILSLREKCAQLRIHVAEDKGQLGQLSPVGMGSENMAGLWAPTDASPFCGKHPQAPDAVVQGQVDANTVCCSPDTSPTRTSVSSSVKESRCCPYPSPSAQTPVST